MNYILDTHAIIWALNAPEKLSKNALKIIENPQNNIWVSAISFWEMSLKSSIGKLDLNGYSIEDIYQASLETGFESLELNAVDASTFYKLDTNYHKDPFDRMLIWQAIQQNYTLITKDDTIQKYTSIGLKTTW